MKNKDLVSQLLILGLAHGFSDALSGFVIYSSSQDFTIKTYIFIVYSLIAFGLQPLSGFITDKFMDYKKATLFGLSSIFIGSILYPYFILPGIFIIAIGSSFFHVGAGAWSIRITPGKSWGPGIYAAPGVLGLALGIYAAINGLNIFLALMVAIAMAVLLVSLQKNNINHKANEKNKTSTKIVYLLLLLLIVGVAIRSSVWTQYQEGIYGMQLLIPAGIAAFLGKIIGGFISDDIPWINFILLSLVGAVLGIATRSYIPALLIGIAFLQSTTPFVLMLLGRLFNKYLAFSVGCIVGLAILLGGALAMLPSMINQYFQLTLIILASALLIVVTKIIQVKYKSRSI